MITAAEMRKLLLEEYGIHNEKELEAALQALGGINISAFVGTSTDCPRTVHGQSADKITENSGHHKGTKGTADSLKQ